MRHCMEVEANDSALGWDGVDFTGAWLRFTWWLARWLAERVHLRCPGHEHHLAPRGEHVAIGGWGTNTEACHLAGRSLPVPNLDVAEKALDVARGLRHLEEHSVVHRDLKMDNVMVASDGRAVLADFGTAVRVRSDGSVQLRQGQSVVGNTAHLAPEVNDAASRMAHAAHETAVHVP